MSTQDVRAEALLNIRCIIKGFHLCRFEVNVGEVLFLLDTIGTFIELLVCMYVIFVLRTIRFVITRLGMAPFFIILQQLMLLLLAISLFAKVQLLLPEFFCESTMQPLSVF